MRLALVIAAAGVALLPEGAAQAGPPADEGRPTTGNSALDAAYGMPPAPGGPPPQGTYDPGYTERGNQRQADQTYGSTATTVDPSGNVVSGLQITDYSDLEQDEWSRPEYHTVQKGDTLWDVSGRYLGDPYLWPKLWSWNDQVTNAHWIFPGDRIKLSDPNGPGGGRGGRGGGSGQSQGPSLSFSKTRLPRGVEPRPYLLNQHAFVDAKQFETAMTITGGAEPAVMMSTLDVVYMSYDKSHPPVPGERLVAYAPQVPVYDAENKEIIGYLVQIMGDIEVNSIAREAAEGTVYASLNPVERGYKVGPLRRRFRRVDPQEAEKSLVGQVVATLTDTGPINVEEPWSAKKPEQSEKKRQRKEKRARKRRKYVLAGEEQFVIVDLGASSGIEVGNVLEVVRKGDAYTEKRVFKLPYEEGWPRNVIASLLVVQVQPETSLCVVTWSYKEVERTDHVEMRGRDLDRGGPSDDPNADRGVDADADARVETGDGKAKASGGFRLGG